MGGRRERLAGVRKAGQSVTDVEERGCVGERKVEKEGVAAVLSNYVCISERRRRSDDRHTDSLWCHTLSH